MRRLWERLTHRAPAEPSDEVKAALSEAEERYHHAGEFLARVERDTARVHRAVARNGFEDAVRRTFIRRPA